MKGGSCSLPRVGGKRTRARGSRHTRSRHMRSRHTRSKHTRSKHTGGRKGSKKRKKQRGGEGQDIWGTGTSSLLANQIGGKSSYTGLPVDIPRDPYLV